MISSKEVYLHLWIGSRCDIHIVDPPLSCCWCIRCVSMSAASRYYYHGNMIMHEYTYVKLEIVVRIMIILNGMFVNSTNIVSVQICAIRLG